MTESEKLICEYVYEFVDKNWDNIDRNNCELTQTKENFLEELETNTETAVWVIMEVANVIIANVEYKNSSRKQVKSLSK